MAEITAELITWMKTRSAITSLVGASTGARIYPERPKQNAQLPYLVISQNGGRAVPHLAGRSKLKETAFEIFAVGDTRAQADALSTAVDDEMTPDNKTMGTTFVTEIVQEMHRDAGDDLPIDGSDRTRYWARSSYRLFYLT